MEKVNGKWLRQVHFDTEEDRKKAMSDWRKRYEAAFPYGDEFCNWLKLPWNEKPVTPKYLKEYEKQEALIEEFYKYKGLYDGLPSDHKYHGNGGKYWDIFYQEQRKINAKHIEETRRRYSKVTQGHTPSTPRRKKKKRIVTEFYG